MVFQVIDNPDFNKFRARAGFKNAEFRLLAGLFSRAASAKALMDMAVDVDFEEGTCTISYYKTQYEPYLSFVVRHVGPRTTMYEVYKTEKGQLVKSGLFQRAFERLEQEIEVLMPPVI
ncbi:MAG: hypothetical protein HYS17_02535 [Micavibrio aeruginosavorus]|uniref:Uncharacterized protein n=1 Tax=Micavibrio aeruginosavorus TaxID=349221 RepID=A0A7T5R3C2_9BACT|nr:MAG: hypothetical protein HYS17_02535 [Micavibrio aeruginosavorus]